MNLKNEAKMKGILIAGIATIVFLSGCSSIQKFDEVDSSKPGAPKEWLKHTKQDEGRGYATGDYSKLNSVVTLAVADAKHDLCAKTSTEAKQKVRTTANVNSKGASSLIATTGSITGEAKSQCQVNEAETETIVLSEGRFVHVYAMIKSENITDIIENTFSEQDALNANNQSVD
jgi:uncharacterized protein YceK